MRKEKKKEKDKEAQAQEEKEKDAPQEEMTLRKKLAKPASNPHLN